MRLQRRRTIEMPMTIDEEFDICHGRGMMAGYELMDLDTFKAKWKLHGKELTAAFIAEHPGRRPFAWWLLVHKNERPVIAKVSKLELDRERNLARFGFLNTHILGKYGSTWGPMQELESDYLGRHNLLSDTERAQLKTLHPEWVW